MADDIQQRISAEGADPLLFAGVNDGNLQELQRTLGVRISFRGDSVTVAGTAEQVERATPVVQGLIDLARIGEPVTPDDVYRLAADVPTGEAAPGVDGKIVLPGLRRALVMLAAPVPPPAPVAGQELFPLDRAPGSRRVGGQPQRGTAFPGRDDRIDQAPGAFDLVAPGEQ